MEKELKELRTEIAGAFEQFKQANDKAGEEVRKAGEATAETTAKVDAINDDISAMEKRLAQMEARAQRPELEGGEAVDPEKELRNSAFEKHIRYGADARARCTPEELRALSNIAAADGGFLIPEDMESDIIMSASALAGFRPVAQVRRTGRDAVRLAGMTNPAVSWGKGNLVQSPVTGLNQANIAIEDLKTLVLVHNNILDDVEADIGAEITQAAARAIAAAEDVGFAAGLGATAEQPSGLILDAGVLARAVPSGAVGGITMDAIIDLMASVATSYRRNGTFMMNSLTEAAVRKLKTTTGEYLWEASSQAGVPATLMGRPVAIDEGMPNIATGAEAIVFGDFIAGYRIYDRTGVTVKRLDERYAELDSTGFIVKKRVGGGVVLPEAFSPLTIG